MAIVDEGRPEYDDNIRKAYGWADKAGVEDDEYFGEIEGYIDSDGTFKKI